MISFRCGTCHFSTVNDEELVMHFLKDHEGTDVKEDPDSKSDIFPSSSDKNEKEMKRTQIDSEEKKCLTFDCSICKMQFPSKYYLRCHKRKRHHIIIFSCTKCLEEFATENQRNQHYDVVHCSTIHKCKLCEFSSGQEARVNYHYLKEHTDRRFLCTECDYKTVNLTNMKKHYRNHPGIRFTLKKSHTLSKIEN